jgi:hypothetical protein
MAQEAKIRVSLDTTTARKELQDLAKMAEGVNLGGAGGGGGGMGLGRMFGMGAAFSAGFAALRGVMSTGLGQIGGELFAPVGQFANDVAFGDSDEVARANRQARESVAESYAMVAGRSGGTPQGARNMFQVLRNLSLQEEIGKTMIRRDLGGESQAAVINSIGTMLKDAANTLADRIGSVGGN